MFVYNGCHCRINLLPLCELYVLNYKYAQLLVSLHVCMCAGMCVLYTCMHVEEEVLSLSQVTFFEIFIHRKLDPIL